MAVALLVADLDGLAEDLVEAEVGAVFLEGFIGGERPEAVFVVADG